jgi:23S rRNA pseudouridine2457 synthase
LILLNKPFGVLCRFSAEVSGKRTLADFLKVPDVYPAGRLDADSEGLVVLTGNGVLQARITSPAYKMTKVYWAEVEGLPNTCQLRALETGIDLRDFVTAPAKARIIPVPNALWPRDPPIRVRKAIPTSWLELTLREGKNRQVRRMTAAVGHPTLRLLRVRMGNFWLGDLPPGHWRILTARETELVESCPD